MTRSRLTLVVGYALALTLFACGGGTTVSETIEHPTISITWPARTRGGDIPAPGSAMSAHVYIEGVNTGANCNVYITRDDNTSLHTGQYPIGQPWTHEPARVTSTFFTGPNQSGDIVGVATADINASGNNFNLINISLVNSVKSCKVIEPKTMAVSTQTQLLFEADGNNNTVIAVSPGSAKWTYVSGVAASLTPDGKITASEAGTVNVKVTVDGIASAVTPITVTEGAIEHVTFQDLTGSDSTASYGYGSGNEGILGGSYSTNSVTQVPHAAIWSNGTRQDCHPAGKHSSVINAMDGVTGAGTFSPNGSQFHAAIFSTGGYTDLAPADTYSEAYAINGSTQVGQKGRKACMWTSTAASFVDLHPGSWRESYATGVSGSNICGWVTDVPITPGSKAVLWSGANHTVTYLDPPGYSGSAAYAISGGTVGGTFTQNDGMHNIHACLWHGTDTTPIDLNPSFAGGSKVQGLYGDVAVGWYVLPNNDQVYRACIWNGTSSKFIDLNAALSATYTTGSQAVSISPDLGGYQVVGWAKTKDDQPYGARVIVWHVPTSALH